MLILAGACQAVCEYLVGFAQLERIEVIVVTMLQVGCQNMVGFARPELIKVIVVIMLQPEGETW